ncbi:hypothetical protein RHSIM_Rhsim11G0011900 [Rhododendron simsii]|uniref:Putative plant transposon protein domain-containing protein n=1 Tax=Rhododendron simsii TaxID=118357 RepID=A0A834LAT7_RHOSS|nr:hypothetical protein RHSIM_Rhsim11G0011900 [Rhododendron simsii]
MAGKGKRRRSGAEPSEPQPDYNTQLFSNRVNEGNWAGFKSRPIVSGRQVMISPRFHRYINNVITAAGWDAMMNIPNVYYPKLVRYFYCNLDIDRNADEFPLISKVKGVDFILDVSTMNDVSVFYQTITDDRVIGGGISKSELKKHLRPLHLFIAHNVAPQKGHYDAVSPLQCLILHSLEIGDYMDLSYLALKEMASVLQDNYKALPYGALLTRLFMRDGVSLTREQTLPNDPGAIRDYVFTRGHIHDEEAPNPQVNIVQEQENIAGEQMAQPQFEGDFSQQMFSRFDALQASQNQMLVKFQQFAIAQNSRFDRVEHRMDHIVQAQQHYFSHYHQQYPAFVPYPPYHPPSPPP